MESTPKGQKPLNPLKGTLKLLWFSTSYPLGVRGVEVENQ